MNQLGLHRYERIWIGFGFAMIATFLILTGISAFGGGHTPSTGMHMMDQTLVHSTPPFDKPGLYKVAGKNQYEAVVVAYQFGFQPTELNVPRGAHVRFLVTSVDVVHGFEIPGHANVNMMVLPGYVSEVKQTFDRPGTYLVMCHEYCGLGHHFMTMHIKVDA